MKTIKLLLTAIAIFLLFTSTQSVQAQNVNIPDANFKAALVSNGSINTNGDAEIQTSEAAAFTGGISVSGLSITDLAGIEAFVLLDSLDCSNNLIAGLDVSANIGLTYLNCSGALVFFEPSNLSSINVTGLNNLTYLDCGANILMSLDVSTNTSLNYLDCSSACVSGGIGGGYYGALTNLNLSGAIALTYLDCSFDGTAMPPGPVAQSSFGYLDVSTNTALTYINCSGNVLTSLDVSSCTVLTTLDCYGNQLANLNISPNSALTYINCSGNALTSLDVSACTALTTLNCSYNQLSSLDVSANTALTTLDCSANQLTSLDVSANTVLIYLSCGANQLTNLNVSANTALTDLYCSDNQLTSLDVSACTALTDLYCSWTQLTSLDVSANTALTTLDCSANQLSNLNVNNGNNMNMVTFYALGNPNLSCIEVDNVAWSNINWPYIDPTASFSENCSGAGILDNNQSTAILSYPNPTSGMIYLSELGNISLIDLSGKLLLEEKNTNQLDLSALPAGMYFLRVGENNNQLVKVIKE